MAEKYRVNNLPAPIDFETQDDAKRILQNVKNLLRTNMGEIPFNRFCGFDSSIMDMPTSETGMELKREVDRVLEWEPRVICRDAEIEYNARGYAVVTAIVEIKGG